MLPVLYDGAYARVMVKAGAGLTPTGTQFNKGQAVNCNSYGSYELIAEAFGTGDNTDITIEVIQ